MSIRRAILPAAASLGLLLAACQPAPGPTEATFEVRGALGGEADPGFARADRPRRFVFPDDHGPHPSFRNEWWYLTGNLESEAGQRFGFQITFFRIALSPTPPETDSGWATNQVWMGHFAITDAARREHHASERFARGALGLAGATTDPPRIWLEDWRLSGPTRPGEPWQLWIRDGEHGLELQLDSQKSPVLQGDRGLSQKSAAPGNASYYYSLTRLIARGRLVSDGVSHTVSGSAWMDREWSTSALGEDQAGWDWFALQLDGDEELMFYQLRKTDGSKDRHSSGSWVFPDQRVMSLGPTDVAIEVLDTWLSPSGIRYPVRWRLRLGPLDRSYEVVPVLADQEMDVSVRYWEGAVDVFGADGQRIGRGYVELAGYEAEDSAAEPEGAR